MHLIIQPYSTPFGTEYRYEYYDDNGNFLFEV